MYRCNHFAIQELIPRHVYDERGEKAWQLLDSAACLMLDKLRTRYGRCIVNNWLFGGDFEWSGLRTPDSPYYRPYSQHSFGRAFDCKFEDMTAEEVREDYIKNQHLFPNISAIEAGVNWFHFDTRNVTPIYIFNP